LVDAGQLDGLTDGDAAVLAVDLDDLQLQFGHDGPHELLAREGFQSFRASAPRRLPPAWLVAGEPRVAPLEE